MTTKITFTPNRRGIQRAGNSEGAYRDLERKADKVIALARAAAAEHYVTGEYDRGFRKERTRIRGQAAVRVVNVSKVSEILEKGSRPHVIEARPGKALFWEGAEHPVQKVNHPGTPAYHFLRNALRQAGR